MSDGQKQQTNYKNLISRNLNNLNDEDMFDLIDYIEAIQPNAIDERTDTTVKTVKIVMDSFTEQTYAKVWDYIRNLSMRRVQMQSQINN